MSKPTSLHSPLLNLSVDRFGLQSALLTECRLHKDHHLEHRSEGTVTQLANLSPFVVRVCTTDDVRVVFLLVF